ncbi:hypothetical protein D3C78_1193910 [compost metagenome]
MPTLCTSAPTEVLRASAGTSRPVTDWISCLAEPIGYSAGTASTSMAPNGSLAARMAASASGLLSSMAITTR